MGAMTDADAASISPASGNNRRWIPYRWNLLNHVQVVPKSDVTQILQAIDVSDAEAAEKLLPLVYAELRELARSSSGFPLL